MDAQYVLCRWRKRFWPAKVLAKSPQVTKSRKRGPFLDVEILSLDKRVRVKGSQVEPLSTSQIENIAALLALERGLPWSAVLGTELGLVPPCTHCTPDFRRLKGEGTGRGTSAALPHHPQSFPPAASQQEVPAAPVEELTYRRALRVALDLLSLEASPHEEGERPRPLPPLRLPLPPPVLSPGLDDGTPEPPERGPDTPACGQGASPEEAVPPGGEEQEEQEGQSSIESVEQSPVRSRLEEDDEEPPRILCYHEPRSFEVGMLVWLKYQKFPYWPAVVKSVRRRDRKASVLFIEGNMDPKGRGMAVSLRRLKHFDCKEKQALLKEAKEDFEQAIGWCVSLITDYRVRLGYPVRKSIERDLQGTRFPALSAGGGPEEPAGVGPRTPRRKVLPDRSRAARDRANRRLVEFIVRRGAEAHLRAVLRGRTPSRWLRAFLRPGRARLVDTYLEDEAQLDLVAAYLQGLGRRLGGRLLAHGSGDGVRLVLEVLLPEAIICAISAVDGVDYKTAEEKYIRGPSPGYREKESFDSQLLEQRSRQPS
ncbi:PWWP domain-containing DNA repair factor 3A isoform X2 [Erinaceus europaeus]|uniref:PWWP domain-containing DNA repair factor 3A isoform X2 n=1 Tax=Erinaceus europaeus TaxID=9365 RepID=A0ABM3WLM3_ERIEU|nr:PWWP domain-containing DNA repair factor 3A isoform X2 [Erinaceus europaeus]